MCPGYALALWGFSFLNLCSDMYSQLVNFICYILQCVLGLLPVGYFYVACLQSLHTYSSSWHTYSSKCKKIKMQNKHVSSDKKSFEHARFFIQFPVIYYKKTLSRPHRDIYLKRKHTSSLLVSLKLGPPLPLQLLQSHLQNKPTHSSGSPFHCLSLCLTGCVFYSCISLLHPVRPAYQ